MSRICMIVQSLYPQDERVRREAEALARQSVEVDVICMKKPNQPAGDHFGSITVYRIMNEAPKESLGRYLWLSFRFALRAMLRLQSLAPERSYEVIQVHNMPDFLVFAALFQKLSGKPVVLDLHDLSVELFRSKWGTRSSTLLQPLVRAVEKLSCSFADELITTSVGFKESLVRRGVREDKITLVLNTADSTIFSYYSNREFKPITQGAKLLYHGTVAERFGLLKAIEAVHLLQGLIPGTTLTIHSNYDPNFRLTLERKISQLHLQSRIILGGFKPLEEIRQIIDRSDLGVVPYLRDDFMELALSTKTFEYAASGLPIVASRLRSISSIFSDESIRFADPGNAQDLAERIAELCRDPERRQRQVQAALKLLPPISGSIMAARYLNLMTRLMMPNRKTNPEGVAVN